MVERDLQEYLFAHPEALFPGETILEKNREFLVQGKRIDQLFRTTEGRHIVELKAVPLSREHIGQVLEYYGLMRSLFKSERFKMLLVAPSIPDFRKIFLEEIGIRCVEIPNIPTKATEAGSHHSNAPAYRRRLQTEATSTYLSAPTSIRYDDLVIPVTKHSLAISHVLLRDSLAEIKSAFPDYEMLPIKMTRADSAALSAQIRQVSIQNPPLRTSGMVGLCIRQLRRDAQERCAKHLRHRHAMVSGPGSQCRIAYIPGGHETARH